MNADFPTWPKPSPIPWCSLVLLVVNAVGIYLAIRFQVSYWWTAPSVVLNVFFFWAERDIYIRENRNFDDWCEEMKYLLGETKSLPWNERISQIRRRRKDKTGQTESSEPKTV